MISNCIILKNLLSLLKTGIVADCLSKETCLAVKHTSLALCDIAKYLLSDLGFSYVLLGKFQSDILESRFGGYHVWRQLLHICATGSAK